MSIEYSTLPWTKARVSLHNEKPRMERRAVLRAVLHLGVEMSRQRRGRKGVEIDAK